MTHDRKPEDLELDELQYTVLIDKQANVLVVDDEPTILKLFESILAETEFNVATASGGQEALEKIEAGDFNLVVIDKNMPVIDGMEVMRRTKVTRPEIEFIVITAFNDATLFQGNDSIGKPDSRQPVRHNNNGSGFGHRADGVDNN